MALSLQTITITTTGYEQMSVTMPAEHVYPFIIHRSIDEYLQKKDGERTRYSNKHIISHLFTGALIGVFPTYKNALLVALKLKNKNIFLMPTVDLVTSHPDMPDVGALVSDLKKKFGCD
jgi:hypothetical protein